MVVVVTLLVYWLAERYAEVLGLAASPDGDDSHGHLGQKITAAHIRHVLGSGWPMIEASVTPLLVLLGCRLLGAGVDTAINVALAYTLVLLVGLGWLAGTRAGLTGWHRGPRDAGRRRTRPDRDRPQGVVALRVVPPGGPTPVVSGRGRRRVTDWGESELVGLGAGPRCRPVSLACRISRTSAEARWPRRPSSRTVRT